MEFNGFDQNDFDAFTIDGLDDRMNAIRERIQPKFKIIGEELTSDLSALLGNEMYLHIARHARRTKNPPNDTWLAISTSKRGYKSHPHFQVGLWDDRLFIWLAYIYELPRKKEIAEKFIQTFDEFKNLSSDLSVSLDHTKKENFSLNELTFDNLERFRDVKKAEFLIGRVFQSNDPILKDGKMFMNIAKKTFETLIPIYLKSFYA